jgi:uncharacterized protein YbjT (DUF2867 family)
MTRVLVTGATGTLGGELLPRLRTADRDVRAASRSPPDDGTDSGERDVEWVELDLVAGAGIDAAVADVDVVVHCASAPTGDTEAVDVEGTERLLAAAERAGVSNFVYPSIVGVEEIPYSYYEHKLAAERAVEASDVDGTILRATQFHEFVHFLLATAAKLPVWFLPRTFRVQPVAAAEVADALVEYATSGASGRVPEVGGPEVHTLGELAKSYREARGSWRPIARVPIPGAVAKGFRAGHNTRPDRAVGTLTWDEWLAERYGEGRESTRSPAGSPS